MARFSFAISVEERGSDCSCVGQSTRFSKSFFTVPIPSYPRMKPAYAAATHQQSVAGVHGVPPWVLVVVARISDPFAAAPFEESVAEDPPHPAISAASIAISATNARRTRAASFCSSLGQRHPRASAGAGLAAVSDAASVPWSPAPGWAACSMPRGGRRGRPGQRPRAGRHPLLSGSAQVAGRLFPELLEEPAAVTTAWWRRAGARAAAPVSPPERGPGRGRRTGRRRRSPRPRRSAARLWVSTSSS